MYDKDKSVYACTLRGFPCQKYPEVFSMYKFESKIRYSEVDETGLLAVPKIVDYFQDCSNFQSDELGVGRAFLEERGLAWVLTFWQIIIDRRPAQGERIRIGTYPYEFKSFMGLRNFFLEDMAGQFLVRANSIWTLLDMKSGRPVKTGEEIVSRYTLEEKLPMDYAARKIIVPEEGCTLAPIVVGRERLDTNHHVNNAQYISMAMNYIPACLDVKELRVEYKKQAYPGDEIYPFVTSAEGGPIVSLRDADGQPYVNVQVII